MLSGHNSVEGKYISVSGRSLVSKSVSKPKAGYPAAGQFPVCTGCKHLSQHPG